MGSPYDAAGGPLDVFTEFAGSGLWPGVGPSVAAVLAEGGITSAPAVTVAALAALPKFTQKRADRLYTSWIGAGQAYSPSRNCWCRKEYRPVGPAG